MARKQIPGKNDTIANEQPWRIPKRGEDGEWYPIIRVGRHIPFGYEQCPEDKQLLLPIPSELELLDQAKEYLKEYSLRVVADWLSKKSGRYISHVGLKKRVSIEERRRYQASHARRYQRLAEEAARKAEKIEGRLGGRGTRKYYGPDENRDSSGEADTSED